MKTLALVFATFTLLSGFAQADTYVNGYYRKNGTYVQPHYRSDSNDTKADNWSTKGNVNPYTGKTGTKEYNSGSYGNDSYGNRNSNTNSNNNGWSY